MRKALGLAVGAAMMAAAPVQAAEWWFVTSSTNDDVVFVDAASIKTTGAKRTFWFQIVYQTVANSAKSEVTRAAIDCDRETSATLSYIDYSDTGRVIRSATIDAPKEHPIAPDTLSRAMMSFVCMPRALWEEVLGAAQISVSPAVYAKNYHETQELLRGSNQ